MKKLWLILGLMTLALAGAFDHRLKAQTFDLKTNTVKLDVIVTDSSHRAVNTFPAERLSVLEDSKLQTLVSLTAEEKPVQYVLAVDTSLSLRTQIQTVLSAAAGIVQLNGPQDRTMLISFISSDKIQQMTRFTSDRESLTSAVDDLYLEGGQSAVIDAAYLAILAAGQEEFTGRRAVVMISDGDDRLSFFKREQLVRLIRQKEIKVFTIGLLSAFDTNWGESAKKERAKQFMMQLASESGGRAFFPLSDYDLSFAIREIEHDLRHQFVLTYQTTNDVQNNFRHLEVRVNGADQFAAYARSGYFVT